MSSPPEIHPQGLATIARLPHDAEAERAVLGAVLLDPGALLHVMEKLRRDEFYLEVHRAIFDTCLVLQERGQATDLLTVTNHLREEAKLEGLGGASYLSSLVDTVPDVANVVHYAEIVRDKAVKRRLIGAAQRILSTCSLDQGEAREAVENAQQDVYQIAEETLEGGFVHISKLARREMEALESEQGSRTGITGLASGFTRLDEMTLGLQRKDLIILAARPSMGKTSLALNICNYASLRSSKKVAVFSLEMSSEQLVRRMLSSEARVDQSRIAAAYLSKADRQKLTMAAQTLQDANVWVDDTPTMSVLELAAKARRMKQERGLDLVMVDYLQLLSGGDRYSSRNEEVSAISRRLKGVAKELDVPMLVLSQLSRQPERRGGDHRPQLSDLRESGSIEQDADVVMFIIRPHFYDPENADPRKAELIIAKQRNGPTGQMELVFQHEYTRFENLDTHHDAHEAPQW